MGKQVELGCKAKDAVSGLTGILTSRHTSFTGMVQWGLQPPVSKKEPDKHPEAISFDENQLAYVGAGEVKRVVKGTLKFDFVLGDEVEDIPTGYKGIVMTRNDWMNGCTTVSIQGKGEPLKDTLKHRHVPVQQVRRIGDGLNVKKAETAPAAASAKGPGGPPQKVERA